MGIKISALPSIVTPLITDFIPVSSDGVTYKETITQLSALLVSNFDTTGTGAFVLQDAPSINNPNINTIYDVSGFPALSLTHTSAAVNYFDMKNAGTGVNPILSAVGSDTNITAVINGKGTGGVALKATGTNDDASSGYVGQYLTDTAISVPVLTATDTNIAQLDLPAGDWDVWGGMLFNGTSATGITAMVGGLSTTSATPATATYRLQENSSSDVVVNFGGALPQMRISTTGLTVYAVATVAFTGGTFAVSATINARRGR